MTPEGVFREGLEYFGIPFDARRLDALLAYTSELERWNRRINLTGLRETEGLIRELIFDAFLLFSYVKESGTIMDMGSGAGVLGIPLAILLDGSTVYSIDKSLKKIQFQRHVKRLLHLEGLTPLHGRVETVQCPPVERLTVKAFGAIPRVLDLAARHVVPGGLVLMVKGRGEEGVDCDGFERKETIPYGLPGTGKTLRLFVYRRTGEGDGRSEA